MALTQCYECGRDISSQGKSCPQCGAQARPPKKKPVSKTFITVLLLFVIGSVMIGRQNRQAQAEIQAAEAKRVAALSPEQRAQEAAIKAQQAASAAELANAQKQKEAAHHDVGLAEVTCQMAAEKAANDPSSIEWLRDERQFSYTSKDMTHALSIQPMRAKNGSGGVVRTGVRCELTKTDNSWNVTRLSEIR